MVDDLPRVFEGHAKLHLETVVELLQALRPRAYDGWTTTTFAHALRGQLGIEPPQVKVGTTNRQSLTRERVLEAEGAALDVREPRPDGDPGTSSRPGS